MNRRKLLRQCAAAGGVGVRGNGSSAMKRAATENHVPRQRHDGPSVWSGGISKTKRARAMKILICFDGLSAAQAIYWRLVRKGHTVVAIGEPSATKFTPDVLLVDIAALSAGLLAQYPETKVFLVNDADVRPEKLHTALLSYTLGGVLPFHAGLQRVWINKGSVKVRTRSQVRTKTMLSTE